MPDYAHHTLTEILDQARAWAATLHQLQLQAPLVRTEWMETAQQEVLFTGCGSPYYLARSAATIFQLISGRAGRACPASDLLFFTDAVLATGQPPLLVVISRSGATTEVLAAVERFRARTAGHVLAITCYPNTSLEQTANYTLIAPEAEEVSLAQTRSFTSMLIAAQGIAHLLARRPLSPAFLALPEQGSDVIAQGHALARELGADLNLERLFFLGSGPFYGLACEAMLKMKEMSLTYSEAYHFLEFRHGPMAMVNAQSLVVGMLSESALTHEVAVLTQMRAMGATVLALTPTRLAADLVDYQIVLPAGLTDAERGPLYLPIPQLLSYYRAVSKGLNPDLPQNLTAFIELDLQAIAARTVTGA